jgi:hypothetical protein
MAIVEIGELCCYILENILGDPNRMIAIENVARVHDRQVKRVHQG